MPTLLLIGITNILGIQILVPLGYEKAVLVSEIVGAVIDLVVNALLIPVYQSSGALQLVHYLQNLRLWSYSVLR